MKTKAQIILDAEGIDYELHFYPPDARLSAQQISLITGVPPERVYKTLICRGAGHRTYVCVIPCRENLDFEKAAAIFQESRLRLAPQNVLKSITGGYEKGSCTPIGLKSDYPVVLDKKMEKLTNVFLNGGQVGILLGLSVNALSHITGAAFADITL